MTWVAVGERTLLKTMEMSRRSPVGSPLTSRNRALWVTGSKTIMNSDGSCSDNTALSPAGNSTESIVIFSMRSSNPSSGKSIPVLQ